MEMAGKSSMCSLKSSSVRRGWRKSWCRGLARYLATRKQTDFHTFAVICQYSMYLSGNQSFTG